MGLAPVGGPNGPVQIVGPTGRKLLIDEHQAALVSPPPAGAAEVGELLTQTPHEQVFADFVYNINGRIIESRANQSGSVTQSDHLAVLQTGAAANSSGQMLTKQAIRYIPGEGIRFRGTAEFTAGVANSLQTLGIGDLGDGFFFGYDGATFGVLHRFGGHPEVRTLTVSVASTDAEDITITLDGDAKTDVTVTNNGSTTLTANEIAAADYSDVGRGWTAFVVNSTVVFVSWDTSSRTGTYTLSSSSSSSGTFAQTIAGEASTDTWVAQASWNGHDIYDGNGPTGEVLNPTKGNVYEIVYQWLGFGAIQFFIEDKGTGAFHLVHTIQYANANTVPSLLQPSLPITVFVGNSSNTSNLTVKTGSLAGMSDGPDDLIGPRCGISAAVTLGATSTETPFLTVRNKEIYQSVINRVESKILLAIGAVEHTKTVQIVAYKDATLTGAAFADVDANNSVLQKDTAATAFTGGTEMFTLSLGKAGSEVLDLGGEHEGTIEPGETITFTIKPKSGNGAEAAISLSLVELF